MFRATILFFLIAALILGTVFSLPGVGLSEIAGPKPAGHCCCNHAGPGLTSCPCCQHHGRPGPCGPSGAGPKVSCHCGTVSLACLSTPPVNIPHWRVSSYSPPLVTVFIRLLPPNIFHPPESSPLFAAV